MNTKKIHRLKMKLAELKTMEIDALYRSDNDENMYNLFKDIEELREKYELVLKELEYDKR